MIRKLTAIILLLSLCLCAAAATAEDTVAPLAEDTRIELAGAGFSMEIPKGWYYMDITEEINTGDEPVMMGDQEMETLAYLLMANEDGIYMMNLMVFANADVERSEKDLASIAEQYKDSGEWREVAGHQFFVFKVQENAMSALMNSDALTISIAGDTLLLEDGAEEGGKKLSADELKTRNEALIQGFEDAVNHIVNSIEFQ